MAIIAEAHLTLQDVKIIGSSLRAAQQNYIPTAFNISSPSGRLTLDNVELVLDSCQQIVQLQLTACHAPHPWLDYEVSRFF